MRLLLDTNALLLLTSETRRMRPEAREAIEQAGEVWFSAVNIWEAAIKAALGKLEVRSGDLIGAARTLGLRELVVSSRQAQAAESLPLYHALRCRPHFFAQQHHRRYAR